MEEPKVPAEEASADDALQFDAVETADDQSGAALCTSCHKPVTGYYYQVNGAVSCVPCRENLTAALASGSKLWRLIKASVYGTIAAALGAGLYFAVLKLTGYQFALIAIVVGVMVGVAVRAGCEGRGGWLYQIIAVLLTYLAISATYVPILYEGFQERARDEIREQLATASAPASDALPEDLAGLATLDGGTIHLTRPYKGLLLIGSIATALAVPFLEFDPIMYVIIGVGLYEAWKLTRRTRYEIAGPFAVAAPVRSFADTSSTAATL